MERPAWMPETKIDRKEMANLLACVGYHCIVRCSDPNASPEDKAMLPGLIAAMTEFLKVE